VALDREAANKASITFFFKSFEVKKINKFVITSNKLTNNFAGLVTSGLGPDATRGRQFDHTAVENLLSLPHNSI
jgi:hypothetical protein